MTISSKFKAKRFYRKRLEIFFLVWLSYVAFYLLRKNFTGAKPAMLQDGWSKGELAMLDASFLFAYAFAQFISGPLGDQFGPRKIFFTGLITAIGANMFIGFSPVLWLAAIMLGINGIAQSSGFPLSCKLIANWFPVALRGRAVGFFLSSYTIGEVLALGITGFIIARWHWSLAFIVPGFIVSVILVLLYYRLYDTPEDCGYPPLETKDKETNQQIEAGTGLATPKAEPWYAGLIELLKHKPIWILVSSYFFIKMVRYTFMLWSNIFLVEKFGYAPDTSTYAVIFIACGGLCGTILSGIASDKLFHSLRIPPAVILLIGLALAIPVYVQLAHQQAIAMAMLSLIGFFAYGADSLLSGAASIDFSSRKAAASGAAWVNGVGSIGAILSSVVGGYVSQQLGWNLSWFALAAITFLSALALSTLWKVRGKT